MNWPETFIQQIGIQLGEERTSFFESLNAPAPISIHLNPGKPFPLPTALERVPWNSQGRYLPFRPVFTLDPLFHAGAYYVQEASSMFLAEAVRQTVDLRKPLRVLDLAAAPGGKSIVLASLLSEESLLLSNEVIQSRYQILKQNIARWGYPNIWTTNHDARGLQKLGAFFDLVVVDAPCSGEGLFRRESRAAQEWSTEQVRYCAARQRKILADTLALLRPGGVLIYSTCTFNAQENTANVQWLTKEWDLTPLTLDLPAEWSIVDTGWGYQFYPHRVKGEGFFLACLQKEGVEVSKKKKRPSKKKGPWKKITKKELELLRPWIDSGKLASIFLNEKRGEHSIIPTFLEGQADQLGEQLHKIQIGTPLGTLKHNKLIPHAAWALSLYRSREIPCVELNTEQALHFLKKASIEGLDVAKGWHLMQYQGFGLGWVKGIGKRYNNYFPNHWRILMDIPEGYASFWDAIEKQAS